MHYVEIQKGPRDVQCAYCHKEIEKGRVFIMKHVADRNGKTGWIPVHIHCNVLMREAQRRLLS